MTLTTIAAEKLKNQAGTVRLSYSSIEEGFVGVGDIIISAAYYVWYGTTLLN